MTRLRGRSPRGERLVCHAPHGHWRTTTMISSVRLDGTTACMTIEGATNTEVFHTYVREILVPSLRPGDIVVMDNLGAHKSERTLALLRKAQARSHPDLLAAISSALAAVTPRDALGWFAHCGYSFI